MCDLIATNFGGGRILLIHPCMNDLVSDSISADHASDCMCRTYPSNCFEVRPVGPNIGISGQTLHTATACEKPTNQMHSTIKSVTKLAIFGAHNETKWTKRGE